MVPSSIPRPRPLDWTFYAGVALMYATFVLVRNPFLGMLVLGLGAFVVVPAGVAIFGRALLRRDRATVSLLGIAALVVGAAYVSVRPVQRAAEYLTFRARRETLASVVREVLAEPRLRQVSAGDRYWKLVNDTPVRDLGPPTPPGGEPPGPPQALPAAEVLRREQVSPTRYRAIREGLLRAGYLDVSVRPEYVMFVEDGLIDNLYGVLWVRPGQAPPTIGRPADDSGTHFTSLRPLGGGWYAFTTT